MSSYQKYRHKVVEQTKINHHPNFFPPLPNKKYEIIYLDPPWDYGGKMQFDRSGKTKFNQNWQKDIFISSATFKYPTVPTKILKTLNIQEIVNKQNCLLLMWTTNPHLKQAIELGEHWGFEYKTVAFIWDKQAHNPGQYTLSNCEMCLLFKKGKIPQPRGLRNIQQLVSIKRTHHSAKPELIRSYIEKMFPHQNKIELFARTKTPNWDAWGLDVES